jgi:hypothetical protein
MTQMESCRDCFHRYGLPVGLRLRTNGHEERAHNDSGH